MTRTIDVKIEGEDELRQFLNEGGPRRIAELAGISLDEPVTIDTTEPTQPTMSGGVTFAPSAPPPGDVTEAGPSLKVPGGQDYNFHNYPFGPGWASLPKAAWGSDVPPDKPQDMEVGGISYNERTFYQLVGVLSLEERVEIVTANWQGPRLSAGEVMYCPLGMCDLADKYFGGFKNEKALPSAATLTSALLLSGRIKPYALEAIYGNTLWFMQNWDAQRIKKRDLADLFQVEYREEGRWHDTAGW